MSFYIKEVEVNSKHYRFLCLDVDGEEITLGYLDRFNKLHLK